MSRMRQELRAIEDQVDAIDLDDASKVEIDVVSHVLESIRKGVECIDETSSKICPHDYVETRRSKLVCIDCGNFVGRSANENH